MVRFFFSSSAALDTKYKIIQQKVITKKGMLTRKQNALSEKLEKYLKQKELSQFEARHVESMMQFYNNDIDVLLHQLSDCYKEIEEMSYTRDDLLDTEGYTANHKLLMDYTYKAYQEREADVANFKEQIIASINKLSVVKPKDATDTLLCTDEVGSHQRLGVLSPSRG